MGRRWTTVFVFVAGLILGMAIYYGALLASGQTTVQRGYLEEKETRLRLLEKENHELTEELFRPQAPGEITFDRNALPYDAQADAEAMLRAAQSEALAEGKFLMVTFGANWCLDCRTLHHYLNSEPVASYTGEVFRFVNVDVGKFNRNREVAESLGVSLARGIPVAVFFGPDGELIGTTNEGQLEPSRHYSSQQILKFVRDIAENYRILSPDSVE